MKPENLTDAELDEWRYRYEERLALLGAPEWPSKMQASVAAREADQAIEELRRNPNRIGAVQSLRETPESSEERYMG